MKHRTLASLFMALVVAFAFVGCRSSLIKNVYDASFVVDADTVTLDDIGKAVSRAGAGLGWEMEKLEPGKIEGTLHLRDHMAKVLITYDMDSYSINYKDSDNLKYDGTNIHTNYNGWISNLQRNIGAQIAFL